MPQLRAQDDLFESSTMTFGQHLEELRRYLFWAILGLVVGCIVGLALGEKVVLFIQTPVRNALAKYYEQEAKDKTTTLSPEQKQLLSEAGYTKESDLEWLRETVAKKHLSFEVRSFDAKTFSPRANGTGAATKGKEAEPPHELKKIVLFDPIADDPRINMSAMGTQEAFMIWMKASLLAGVVLASPWIFYQIWQFVAAGLYPHERRYVHIFLPFSVALFLGGAALAFFVAFDKVLAFLLSFNHSLHINPELRIEYWMSFVLLLPLGFGISFQLPLVMLFLERIGLLTVQTYLQSWRIAVLVIFVLAMILTPSPDPASMCLMAVPLTVLYFGGVLLCKFFPRVKRRA